MEPTTEEKNRIVRLIFDKQKEEKQNASEVNKLNLLLRLADLQLSDQEKAELNVSAIIEDKLSLNKATDTDWQSQSVKIKTFEFDIANHKDTEWLKTFCKERDIIDHLVSYTQHGQTFYLANMEYMTGAEINALLTVTFSGRHYYYDLKQRKHQEIDPNLVKIYTPCPRNFPAHLPPPNEHNWLKANRPDNNWIIRVDETSSNFKAPIKDELSCIVKDGNIVLWRETLESLNAFQRGRNYSKNSIFEALLTLIRETMPDSANDLIKLNKQSGLEWFVNYVLTKDSHLPTKYEARSKMSKLTRYITDTYETVYNRAKGLYCQIKGISEDSISAESTDDNFNEDFYKFSLKHLRNFTSTEVFQNIGP